MSRNDPLELRAGPLRAMFFPADAFLRYVRLGEEEVLRGVYGAVRDKNWATIRPRVENVDLEERDGGFAVDFDVSSRERDIDFSWRGRIEGGEDGSLAFLFEGRARSTFLRNRIGLCVLHPASCAGRPCTVETAGGRREESRFPEEISPHQPFLDLRAIAHEVSPGVRARVELEGDNFETEDQRNWTDASFKTYSTPLRLPFPVEVKAGEEVRQAVRLRIERRAGAPLPRARRSGPPVLRVEDAPARARLSLPRLGLQVASHGEPLRKEEVAALRKLALDHLRADLAPSKPDFRERLERAAAEARALDCGLEVALHLGEDIEDDLRRTCREIATLRAPVERWLVFQGGETSTARGTVELARARLREAFPGVLLGSGTDAYFTELNRARPPAELLDLVCYSLNPQVHAFDDLSLVETLAIQGETVRNARRFSAGRPVAVTPVTLRPRSNPNATSPEPALGPDGLPRQVDVRQATLLGAIWTLGSIKYLAESGAASVTSFETSGWLGVMERAEGSPMPESFPSIPGGVFPLFHVLADVRELAGAEVRPVSSSEPLEAVGLLLETPGQSRLLVANLTAKPLRARVEGWNGAARVVRRDEENRELATRRWRAFRETEGEPLEPCSGGLELELGPHAYARIDGGRSA